MRSIGIDSGDRTVKVVELEGSYKKARLLRVHTAPAGAPGADANARAEAVAAAARAALDGGMRGDVSVGHPCREAVLRTIEVPFKGTDAIRKVIKAEIEGEIQSQSVDDMVVDFHEIGVGATGGTRILVASVPKAGLRAQLAALTGHAIEPEVVDLDTMALWRAAHWVGAFDATEPSDEAAADAGADAGDKRVTAVIDIGSRSVRVLLVDGEQLIEMRALRLGDGVVADEVARRHGIGSGEARDAVFACLTSGSDQRIEVAVATPAPAVAGGETGEDAPVAAPAMREVLIAHGEVESAHEAFLQRLARELTRFLTASGRASELRALWITGGASRLPGTREMLAAVFGVEVRDIDVLARLPHDLSPEEAIDLAPRLTTAVGLALGRFGGPEGFQLRQEDLVLTRGFERVKFPLAIACMVALLAMFVHWNKKQLQLTALELEIGRTFVDKDGKKTFFGELSGLFRESWFDKADRFTIDQKGKNYTYPQLIEELASKPVSQRLAVVRERLRTVAEQKQKESGIFEDISLESGLAVLVRWAEMLKATESQLGRFLITKVELNMRSPNRQLEFTIVLRDEFRLRKQALMQAMDAEFAKPDSPFEKRPGAREREELFRDPNSGEIDPNSPGAYYYFTLGVKDSFQPFATNAVGAAAVIVPQKVDLEGEKLPGKNEVATTGGGK